MSDPRDDAFRHLLDTVRAFNRKPNLERRHLVRLAAAKFVWAHKATDPTTEEE